MSKKDSIIKAFSSLLDGILGDKNEQETITKSSVELTNNQSLIRKSLDEEKRKATFVVLAPDEVDLHGDIYSAEEVEKAADNFNENCMRPNLAHMLMIDEGDPVSIVESYVAPSGMTIGDVSISKGTWLQTWKFNDESLWQGVKDGYWNGLSVGCKALCEDL